MKKIVYSFFLTICLFFKSYSQENTSNIKFGPLLSYNETMLGTTSTGVSAKSIGKYQIGFFLNIPLKGFALQTELLYSAQGSKVSYQSQTNTLNINYLKIPILAVAQVLKSKKGNNLSIVAGPYIATKVSVTDSQNSMSSNEYIKPLDFGFTGGFQYQYSKLLLRASWSEGLSNIYNNSTVTSSSTKFDFNNQVLSLGVGYLIN